MSAPLLDAFVEECRRAAVGPQPLPDITAAMKRLVADPAALRATIAAPDPATATQPSGFDTTLFADETISVLSVHATPGIEQPPHDHLISAVIGGYDGNEQQRFFRRTPDGIVAAGGQPLRPGETLSLGPTSIHAITAEGGGWSRAIHVYLGNLDAIERSLFDPDSFAEEPHTVARYEALCRPHDPA